MERDDFATDQGKFEAKDGNGLEVIAVNHNTTAGNPIGTDLHDKVLIRAEPGPLNHILNGAIVHLGGTELFSVDPSLALGKEDEESLTFRSLKGIVDELEIQELSPKGQVLRLVKRFNY